MAANGFLIVIVVAVLANPAAFATEYVVGDYSGWTLRVDYSTWAQGKQFYVGDKLVFKYDEGKHNVYKVNGTAFQQCAVPSPSVGLTSGNDIITLTTPGRKWYICGVGEHCNYGMKLAITVSSCAVAPASAPTPLMQDKIKPMGFWTYRKFH